MAAVAAANEAQDARTGETSEDAQDAPPSKSAGAGTALDGPLAEGRRSGSTNLTQDASAAGAAGEGPSAVSLAGRLPPGAGETSAAR
jgi:hypothetical protein